MAQRKIKRALISVYDKTGIVDFARALIDEFGIEIIATGGTAALLKNNDIPVTLVEEITGFPEMMDGRVKTLHPKIHAAILADRDNPKHTRQLKEHGIEPIDMVVVNLYPFEKVVADPNCTFDQAIEMIDIGGPCLLRTAAKNHQYVLAVSTPDAYEPTLKNLRTYQNEGDWDDLYQSGAFRAFLKTTDYDAQVVMWLGRIPKKGLTHVRFLQLWNRGRLRYGENPHQQAELLSFHQYGGGPADRIGPCTDNEGTQMSFNNYVDSAAALALCKELTREQAPMDVGPTFQSVRSPVTEEQHTERHLPHIQNPGSHYFVTFRLRSGSLHPEERDIVLEACKHWHRTKMTVHACVVMPDHVHLLMTPHEAEPGEWVPLGDILRSIKGYSDRKINERRGTSGSVWLNESWDRIVRNEKEYGQRWEYIESNPEKAGWRSNYPWLWLNERAWHDLAEFDRLESRSHTRSRHRVQRNTYACVFIKHTNACGVGISGDPVEAYQRAYLGDPNAAMGGVLACSFDITADFAEAVMGTYDRWGKEAGASGFFVEVWIAPTFDEAARKVIRTSKKWGERVRLLPVGDMDVALDDTALEYKTIATGMLAQTQDVLGLNEVDWKVVTKRALSEWEINDLRLAWLVCKHTKSNAITICKDNMLIGNGAGQASRVMSCRVATWLAEENGHADKLAGSVAASDAFFPFPDGPKILMDAGVTAIIQPGGAKRDGETITACDKRGVAMIFTGTRHFKH